MKFLVDAGSDARLVPHLRRLGQDVTRVGWDYPRALTDPEILDIARREGRTVITDDRDFGELVFRLRQPHAGVLYLRLETTRLSVLIARLDDVLATHRDRLDRFLVVTRTEVRERSA